MQEPPVARLKPECTRIYINLYQEGRKKEINKWMRWVEQKSKINNFGIYWIVNSRFYVSECGQIIQIYAIKIDSDANKLWSWHFWVFSKLPASRLINNKVTTSVEWQQCCSIGMTHKMPKLNHNFNSIRVRFESKARFMSKSTMFEIKCDTKLALRFSSSSIHRPWNSRKRLFRALSRIFCCLAKCEPKFENFYCFRHEESSQRPKLHLFWHSSVKFLLQKCYPKEKEDFTLKCCVLWRSNLDIFIFYFVSFPVKHYKSRESPRRHRVWC